MRPGTESRGRPQRARGEDGRPRVREWGETLGRARGAGESEGKGTPGGGVGGARPGGGAGGGAGGQGAGLRGAGREPRVLGRA